MFRVLLVFTTIGVVFCQSQCPEFVEFLNYPHDPSLVNLLIGEYKEVYTSTKVVGCQRITYAKDANNVVTGHIESPLCCLMVNNITSNPDELGYGVGPLPGYANDSECFPFTENGSLKFLTTTGSGSSLCIIAVCQEHYYGLCVLCRGKAPLLFDVIVKLLNLLGVIGISHVTTLKPQTQLGCFYPSGNCPNFN